MKVVGFGKILCKEEYDKKVQFDLWKAAKSYDTGLFIDYEGLSIPLTFVGEYDEEKVKEALTKMVRVFLDTNNEIVSGIIELSEEKNDENVWSFVYKNKNWIKKNEKDDTIQNPYI